MDNWFTQLMICAQHQLPKERWPRKGFCDCCGQPAWLTNEEVAYSSHRAYLCDMCGPEERKNVEAAWAEYYSGRL